MKFKITAIAAALLATTASHATPLPVDTFHAYYLYPDKSTVSADGGTQTMPFFFNVGGVLEWSTGNVFTLNTGLVLDFASAAFNGLELVDITGSDIANVVYESASTLKGFDASRIGFDSSHIWLNLEGLGNSGSGLIGGNGGAQTAVVKVTFAGSPPPAVPEPATLALFGAGLLGFSALRRHPKTICSRASRSLPIKRSGSAR